MVLTGPGILSSCESFIMMMRQVPDCRLVGGRSGGSSGRPQPWPLGNGVVVYIPSWKDMDVNGQCIEGEGVPPDIEVRTTLFDFEKSDPVLEAGLKALRGGAAG